MIAFEKKMKKRLAILGMSVFLTGCGTNVEPAQELNNMPVVSDNSIEAVSENEVSPFKELTLTVTNLCGADFGMFSAIDPQTEEQIQLGAIPDGELLMVDMSWPREVNSLNWAIYNSRGELYMEGKTAVVDAESQVIITFVGNGAVEEIVDSVE